MKSTASKNSFLFGELSPRCLGRFDEEKPIWKHGADIVAYDPKARHEAETCYLKDNKKVSYVDSKYEALKNADAILLITEWQEFRSPDFDEIKKLLKYPLFFDGRNQFKQQRMEAMGFEYIQIGVTA